MDNTTELKDFNSELEGLDPKLGGLEPKLDKVTYSLGEIENYSRAITLIVKHHLYYSENQSPYINDIKANACEYKEDNEVLLEFIYNSLQQLTHSISKQYETMLNL